MLCQRQKLRKQITDGISEAPEKEESKKKNKGKGSCRSRSRRPVDRKKMMETPEKEDNGLSENSDGSMKA